MKLFARVLQEFPDQEAVAKVARTRLGDKASPSAPPESKSSADPNATNLKGETPLHGTPEVEKAQMLLDAGAEINAKAIDGTGRSTSRF